MTPAQRKYDQDLALSLRNMAQWIEPRSRKVSGTLTLAADRIEALSASIPIDQPASQPDQARPEPVRN